MTTYFGLTAYIHLLHYIYYNICEKVHNEGGEKGCTLP